MDFTFHYFSRLRPALSRRASAALVLFLGLAAQPIGRCHAQRGDDLFKQSAEHYKRGEFEQAAALLERAYELDPQPVLLYNLARAYENSGTWTKAIDAYERFLQEEPDAADRVAIKKRIAVLRKNMEEQEALRVLRENQRNGGPRPLPEGSEEPGQKKYSIAPWIIASVSAAAAATGLGLALRAQSLHNDAVDEPSFQEASSLQSRAVRLFRTANGTLATSGALFIAGVTWLIVDRLKKRERNTTVSLSPAPGLVLATVDHRFP